MTRERYQISFEIDPRIFFTAFAVSLISIFPFNIGFYALPKTVISICVISAALTASRDGKEVWIFFALLGLLYNPIIPVNLNDKYLWSILNLGTAIIFLWVYKQEDPNSSWMDKYLFFLARAILLGMSAFVAFSAIVLIASGQGLNFQAIMLLTAFAASVPSGALLINYFFWEDKKLG
jgi:hypothetical protein